MSFIRGIMSESKKPILVSLRLAARHIGVKAESLRQAAEKGEIPSVRVGSDLLFDVHRVEEILLSRAADGGTDASR